MSGPVVGRVVDRNLMWVEKVTLVVDTSCWGRYQRTVTSKKRTPNSSQAALQSQSIYGLHFLGYDIDYINS